MVTRTLAARAAEMTLRARKALAPYFYKPCALWGLAQGAAAATLLVWFKMNEHVYPPAAVLAGLLVTASQEELSFPRELSFVAVPWLLGHAALYAAALALAKLRAGARVRITKRQFVMAHEAQSDEDLRRTFDTFDTSKDGQLDAAELKVS